MKIQFGTVDGLINISEQKIRILVNAIKEFSNGGIEIAQQNSISLGAGFQRFVEPVYTERSTEFNLNDIKNPVYTKGGKEQSPARVTFCKKMGLLDIDDENNIFKLTPLAEKIWSKEITVEEYAFILLTKQAIFKDGIYDTHIISYVYNWFLTNTIISEDEIKKSFEKDSLEKTRIDIILNAFVICGLLTNINSGKYVISNLKSAEIIKFLYENTKSLGEGVLDNDSKYLQYIGSLNYGIFNILNKNVCPEILEKYPNLQKYVTSKKDGTDGNSSLETKSVAFDKNLLTAMRTKPFLLLAGISGTGKSRIVKQMAFESCPDIEELRSDKTSPGNYQLIEVKPNWHDSTEVLGYESEIGGKHYVATPFVKFLVKAMCYPKVPFFVCMDEMNLAPVEQYFAEFLSVLESRKLLDDKKTITSESLIDADVFKKYEEQLRVDLRKKSNDESASNGSYTTNDEQANYGKFEGVYKVLKEKGLRIPSNLIVVGTVNMDETTHQFSRKVIDRAMTIEMNIKDAETPFKNFFEESKDLEYKAKEEKKELFLPTVVQAKEAMKRLSDDDKECLTKNVPTLLYELNQALNGTPFKIAYRVQNELVLYFNELRKEQPEAAAVELLKQAMDAILMLKVLPRIEGDEDLLEKPLERLHKFTENYTEALKKVEEMQTRLKGGHFTSFWP